MKKIHFTYMPVYIQRYVRWRAWHHVNKGPINDKRKALGIDTSFLSKLVKRKILPSPTMAKKLDQLTDGAVKYADTMLEVQKIRDYSKEKNKELRILKEKMRYKKCRADRLIQYENLAKKLKKETDIKIPAHLKTWRNSNNL